MNQMGGMPSQQQRADAMAAQLLGRPNGQMVPGGFQQQMPMGAPQQPQQQPAPHVQPPMQQPRPFAPQGQALRYGAHQGVAPQGFAGQPHQAAPQQPQPQHFAPAQPAQPPRFAQPGRNVFGREPLNIEMMPLPTRK
jgi:hypothetical protein